MVPHLKTAICLCSFILCFACLSHCYELDDSTASSLIYRCQWAEALSYLESDDCALGENDRIFLQGYASLRLGKCSEAESLFSILLGREYELADWAIVFLAQSSMRCGHYDAAFRFSKLAGILPGLRDTVAHIRWYSLKKAGKVRDAIIEASET